MHPAFYPGIAAGVGLYQLVQQVSKPRTSTTGSLITRPGPPRKVRQKLPYWLFIDIRSAKRQQITTETPDTSYLLSLMRHIQLRMDEEAPLIRYQASGRFEEQTIAGLIDQRSVEVLIDKSTAYDLFRRSITLWNSLQPSSTT